MEKVLQLLASFADILWSWPTIILVFATTLWLTFKTRAFQFRRFGHIMRNTFGKLTEKSDGDKFSPFRACCVALANTIGTGNVAGVASAIAVGGPGAVFWMELMALFGMLTKTCEVSLAVHYRDIDQNGNPHGSPMMYMRKGLGWNGLAKLFAVALIINCFLTTGLVQPNTVCNAFLTYYGINPYITAVFLALICGYVIFGGNKRIGEACNFMVPFMSIFYVVFSLVVIVARFDQIPGVIQLVFSSAFKPVAAVGGFTGSVVEATIRKGLSRGMYSNEAGQGTAPIAHAFAKTKHPIEQGLWGAFEVFVDTTIVCSMTAFVVLSTGAWTMEGVSGVTMVLAGFDSVFGGRIASMIICVTILFFCFSCQVGFSLTGIMAVKDVFGDKKLPVTIFKVLYLIPGIVFAGVSDFNAIAVCADIVTACEAIPNLIVLLALSGVFFELLKDYETGAYKYSTANVDSTHNYVRLSKKYALKKESAKAKDD